MAAHIPSMFICIMTTGSMVWWVIRITRGPPCPCWWVAPFDWRGGVWPVACWSDWPAPWGDWCCPSVCLPLDVIVTVVPKFNCKKEKDRNSKKCFNYNKKERATRFINVFSSKLSSSLEKVIKWTPLVNMHHEAMNSWLPYSNTNSSALAAAWLKISTCEKTDRCF